MRADAADAHQLNDPGQERSFLYDAFISYDHDDRPVAHGIQRGLHRVGRRLGRPHALRVFRDSTDLSASPDLWGKVTEAMDRSRYMIAVLSPHAVASAWVDREVAYWLERRGPDQLMFVVAGGHLNWDIDKERFDAQLSDAALPVLTKPGALPTEPFYVDVTDDAPWDPAAPLFREKVIDLAAPIHGKPKYELASEDLREQQRFVRLRRAAIISLALLSIIAITAAVIAFIQRQSAIHQRNEALARQLVTEGQAILAHIREGSDARAISEILAARKIADKPDEGAVLNALQSTFDQLKIIDTGADVDRMSLSTDGQRILTMGIDLRMTIRGADTGLVTATFPKSWGFSADGSRVLSSTNDGRLQVRDTKSGQPIGPAVGVSKDGGALLRSAFSPDLRKIAFAQYPSFLFLWDIETGRVVPMSGFSEGIADVVFTPDGHRVVSSGYDGAIRVWNAENGLQLSQPISMQNNSASALAVSSDGRRLITGGTGNTVHMWDLESGQPLGHQMPDPVAPEYVTSVGVSRDGRRIVSGSTDHTIQIWDAETGAPIGSPLTGHRDAVRGVAFSANSDQIISASSDKTIRIWKANPTHTLGDRVAGEAVSGVAVSADGRRIVSSDGATITVWDAKTFELLLPPLVGETDTLALSRDGARIASLNAGTVTIWDANSGTRISQWETGQQLSPPFGWIVFSPDGQTVATFGGVVENLGPHQTEDMSIVVWDARSGNRIGPPVDEHTDVTDAAFSPDSRHLAYNKNQQLRIVDVASGHTVNELTEVTDVRNLAYRPDGKQIMVVGRNSIRLLDPPGHVVAEMTDAYPRGLSTAIFSVDGKYIISGHGSDIRIWDAQTHQAIGDLTGGQAFVSYLGITSDNRSIVANNFLADNFAAGGLWPGPAAWPDLLCTKLTRNMSRAQWREWVSPDIDYIELCPGLPVVAE